MDFLRELFGWVRPTPKPEPDIEESIVDELLKIHNSMRGFIRLGQLELDDSLNKAAQEHAEWMASKGFLSHTGKSGTSHAQRAKIAGYKGYYIAENIAMSSGSPKEVCDIWYKSAGHKRNMLDERFKHVGFGKSGNYWCALFGA